MRKLASIRTISNLIPIEGKDRIELVVVDGWQVIVQKGEYKIGDKTVFVEPDSQLPEKKEFEFLRRNKFRIKTMKMGGVLSQGICFQLNILPKGDYEVGQDVTDLMGIVKYVSQHNNSDAEDTQARKHKNPIIKYMFRYKWFRFLFSHKKQKNQFPSFISKTDETRVQNLPYILQDKDLKFEVTEKIDGQSSTFFLKRKKFLGIIPYFDFGVCSRNLRLPKSDDGIWSLVDKYQIKEVLKEIIGKHNFVAIQGEHIAPKVQGNKYKVTESDLRVFNLIYPDGKANYKKMFHTLTTLPYSVGSPFKNALKLVPILDLEYTLPDTVNELLDYATGKSKLYDTLREGVVLRNYEKNISFKAVSPDFLIKNDE